MAEFKLKKIERDENNLIKGINYTFDENGRVNWRKLIKNEFLVANKDRTQETDVSKLDDKDVLVLLNGFKEVADIRGFTDVHYEIINASPEFCSASCKINWIPCYENENRAISFESTADATFNNTTPIGNKYYLTSTAENRAFVRCVRNFLRISVLGKDEISFGGQHNGFKSVSAPENKFAKILTDLMAAKKVDWPKIADKLKKENLFKEDYTGPDTLPKDILFDMIERIKKMKDAI